MAVCTGVGKWLHTLPPYLTLAKHENMADKQQQFQPYHFFVSEFVADTLHINQLHGRDAGNEVCLNHSKQFSAIGHLLLE